MIVRILTQRRTHAWIVRLATNFTATDRAAHQSPAELDYSFDDLSVQKKYSVIQIQQQHTLREVQIPLWRQPTDNVETDHRLVHAKWSAPAQTLTQAGINFQKFSNAVPRVRHLLHGLATPQAKLP